MYIFIKVLIILFKFGGERATDHDPHDQDAGRLHARSRRTPRTGSQPGVNVIIHYFQRFCSFSAEKINVTMQLLQMALF
jgi:hypothetical protein